MRLIISVICLLSVIWFGAWPSFMPELVSILCLCVLLVSVLIDLVNATRVCIGRLLKRANLRFDFKNCLVTVIAIVLIPLAFILGLFIRDKIFISKIEKYQNCANDIVRSLPSGDVEIHRIQLDKACRDLVRGVIAGKNKNGAPIVIFITSGVLVWHIAYMYSPDASPSGEFSSRAQIAPGWYALNPF